MSLRFGRNLHLKCDVLFIVYAFEKFRNNLYGYGSRLGHYLIAPSLSWDAMLHIINKELKYIPDPGMRIFFEKGTRGRVSYISNRHSKANNKYLKSDNSK